MKKSAGSKITTHLIILSLLLLLLSAVPVAPQSTDVLQGADVSIQGTVETMSFFLPDEENQSVAIWKGATVFPTGQVRFNISIDQNATSAVRVTMDGPWVRVTMDTHSWNASLNKILSPGESYQGDFATTITCHPCHDGFVVYILLIDSLGNASGTCWCEILKKGTTTNPADSPDWLYLGLFLTDMFLALVILSIAVSLGVRRLVWRRRRRNKQAQKKTLTERENNSQP